MARIKVKLNREFIPCESKYKDSWGFEKTMDGFKVRSMSGYRVYIVTIKNGVRMCEIAKTMKFEDGNVIISFGKNKRIVIGTYTEESEEVS